MSSSPAAPRATSLPADATVVASREQVSCDLDGEAVILSLRTGAYYGLDPVAARVWELVQEPRALSAVCEVLLAEYEGVTAEQCEREVRELVAQLAEWELVEVSGAAQV